MRFFKNTPTLAARSRHELNVALKQLKRAKKIYARGNFTGRPEEQLEKIEQYQNRIADLTQAADRGWSVNPETVAEIERDFSRFQDDIPEDTPGYERIVGIYHKLIDEARQGLI